jgi:hypothetical protein
MRRGAAGLAALGAATLVLAAWVTTAAYVPILRGVVPDPTRTRGGRPTLESPATAQPPKLKPHDQAQGFGVDITIVMYAILVLLLIAVAALLLRSALLRRRLRREPRKDAATGDLADDGWELSVSDDLARSAARGLVALTEGEPRNAIVRCWAELEDAVERTGLARDPALTSEEFASDVLQRFAVGRTEIETLGALYREARFSEHVMGEVHRDAAIRALTALRDDLSRFPQGGGEPVPAAEPGR